MKKKLLAAIALTAACALSAFGFAGCDFSLPGLDLGGGQQSGTENGQQTEDGENKKPEEGNKNPEDDKKPEEGDKNPGDDKKPEEGDKNPEDDKKPEEGNKNPEDDKKPEEGDKDPEGDKKPEDGNKDPDDDKKPEEGDKDPEEGGEGDKINGAPVSAEEWLTAMDNITSFKLSSYYRTYNDIVDNGVPSTQSSIGWETEYFSKVGDTFTHRREMRIDDTEGEESSCRYCLSCASCDGVYGDHWLYENQNFKGGNQIDYANLAWDYRYNTNNNYSDYIDGIIDWLDITVSESAFGEDKNLKYCYSLFEYDSAKGGYVLKKPVYFDGDAEVSTIEIYFVSGRLYKIMYEFEYESQPEEGRFRTERTRDEYIFTELNGTFQVIEDDLQAILDREREKGVTADDYREGASTSVNELWWGKALGEYDSFIMEYSNHITEEIDDDGSQRTGTQSASFTLRYDGESKIGAFEQNVTYEDTTGYYYKGYSGFYDMFTGGNQEHWAFDIETHDSEENIHEAEKELEYDLYEGCDFDEMYSAAQWLEIMVSATEGGEQLALKDAFSLFRYDGAKRAYVPVDKLYNDKGEEYTKFEIYFADRKIRKIVYEFVSLTVDGGYTKTSTVKDTFTFKRMNNTRVVISKDLQAQFDAAKQKAE